MGARVVSVPPERVAAVRGFNRFYTNAIGALREGLLDSPYSLTEARLIFELAQVERMDVVDLRRSLDIDAGYLSRILARFERAGLVTRERSERDARRQVIRLARRGRSAFKMLDSRSAKETGALLGRHDPDEQRRLVDAMRTISGILGDEVALPPATLRAPRSGDYGWVVERHGAIYATEYGWDETFEALVARIVADFIDERDASREAAWIADLGGSPAGCVFCVKREAAVAQLRLLLVEPTARGRGIGAALVNECVAFARRAGYERMMLWTNDVLVDARRIYERAGFVLAEEHGHRAFGHDLVSQDWWLTL